MLSVSGTKECILSLIHWVQSISPRIIWTASGDVHVLFPWVQTLGSGERRTEEADPGWQYIPSGVGWRRGLPAKSRAGIIVLYWLTFAAHCCASRKIVTSQFEVFTKTRSWQCWHYCQLFLPILLQFSSLFAPTDTSKCDIIIKAWIRITLYGYMSYWTSWFLKAELKWSWQCWHSCKEFVKNSVETFSQMNLVTGWLDEEGW